MDGEQYEICDISWQFFWVEWNFSIYTCRQTDRQKRPGSQSLFVYSFVNAHQKFFHFYQFLLITILVMQRFVIRCYYPHWVSSTSSNMSTIPHDQLHIYSERNDIILPQCLTHVFARGPFLASRNNRGSSHPCWRKVKGEIVTMVLITVCYNTWLQNNNIRTNLVLFLVFIVILKGSNYEIL
jgi:hypothetical protein